MPERLDRVAISTQRGVIELPWASRDKLLHEIRSLNGAERVRTALEAVGASQPVALNRDDKLLLFDAITNWAASVTIKQLPDGVWKLRNVLAAELHDAPNPK